ncbi:MAG: PQQ-dependent sugar dehydrogenase [Acidimicrobiales bacterium]
MGPRDFPHNSGQTRLGLARRAIFGALSLLLGIALLACSAPATSSQPNSSGPASPTTAVDPGTGPTAITKTMGATEVADGFGDATNIVSRPARNQLWVSQRSGLVTAIEIETSWNLELGQTQRKGFKTFPVPVLNISRDVATQGERGLLGIAFSSDAQTLFLSYVSKDGDLVIASWAVTDLVPPPVTIPAPPAPPAPPVAAPTVPGAPPTTATTTTTTVAPSTSTTQVLPVIPAPFVDPASKRVLLSIPHEGETNYSGQLTLGYDGFLYIGVGDAPTGGTENLAQNPDSLLGKILRIDPGGATLADPYGIPPGNPYAKGGGAPQIWTTGAQNPLRFSFDRANGNMWVADAGHGKFSEIDYLPVSKGGGSGANLGWPYLDGKEPGPAPDKAPSTLTAPLIVAPLTSPDCPVIGGFVYRGAITEMRAVYIYGDFCSGTVRGLLQRKAIVLDDKPIGPRLGANSIVAFAEDSQGELYILTRSGSVQRLVAE